MLEDVLQAATQAAVSIKAPNGHTAQDAAYL